MNLSHVIHEFSFGPFFPAIAQPLDMTYAIAEHRELDTLLPMYWCVDTLANPLRWVQNSRSFNIS